MEVFGWKITINEKAPQ